MTTGLKALGIIGTGTLLALGASSPEPIALPNTYPAPQVVPEEVESKKTIVEVTEVSNATPKEKEKVKPETKVAPVIVPAVTKKKNEEPAKVEKVKVAEKPAAKKVVVPTSSCHSGYSGCLKVDAGDYDCAGGSGNGPNYTGTVQVYGTDPFDLDRDNDGVGCE